MIYLLQPADYQPSVKELLETILHPKQLSLQVMSDIPSPTPVFNTYFIINDAENETWSGMAYARAIRAQDKTGHLILLAEEMDYTHLFRSHLSFLAALPFKEIATEVREYVDEFY